MHVVGLHSTFSTTLLKGLYGYVRVTVRESGPLCMNGRILISDAGLGLEKNMHMPL